MNYDEKSIDFVTKAVLSALEKGSGIRTFNEKGPIFDSVDEAVEAAYEAQKVLATMSLAQKRGMIDSIRRKFRGYVQESAHLNWKRRGWADTRTRF